MNLHSTYRYENIVDYFTVIFSINKIIAPARYPILCSINPLPISQTKVLYISGFILLFVLFIAIQPVFLYRFIFCYPTRISYRFIFCYSTRISIPLFSIS